MIESIFIIIYVYIDLYLTVRTVNVSNIPGMPSEGKIKIIKQNFKNIRFLWKYTER